MKTCQIYYCYYGLINIYPHEEQFYILCRACGILDEYQLLAEQKLLEDPPPPPHSPPGLYSSKYNYYRVSSCDTMPRLFRHFPKFLANRFGLAFNSTFVHGGWGGGGGAEQKAVIITHLCS